MKMTFEIEPVEQARLKVRRFRGRVNVDGEGKLVVEALVLDLTDNILCEVARDQDGDPIYHEIEIAYCPYCGRRLDYEIE